MSGTGGINAPNFAVPYIAPDNVPAPLKPIIQPIYTAMQNIIKTLIIFGGIAPRDPTSILSSNNDPTAILSNNVHRFYCQALEPIGEGSAVNFFSPAGVLFARNAVAIDFSHQADAFCSQIGGLQAGQVGEFIWNDGVILNLSGWSPGVRYWLSATSPGSYTVTPPTGVGEITQSLGIALTTTSFRFWTGTLVQH